MKLFIPGAGGKVNHILNFQEHPDVEKVIISDIYPWTYGTFVADVAYQVPRFDDPTFFEVFDRIYQKERFDVCLPINDFSLYLFASQREKLKSYPFTLAICPQETIDLVADKLLNYEFFVTNNIPTAKVYTMDEFLNLKIHKFPYYIKPRYIHMRGTQKQLYMKLEDSFDLDYILKKIQTNQDDYVVQDFISGREINIDFFCDANGEVKSIVPLERQGMGLSRGITRGEMFNDSRFDSYIYQMAEKLKFWGANNVQVYMDENENLTFTEINGRFSGSSIFVKEAGVNFFHYFIELLKGNPVEINEKPRYLRMASWEKPFFFTKTKAKMI